MQTPHNGLEQLAQKIAVAEATVSAFCESRVIRHLAIQAQTAKPAISEVQVNLLAQPALRPDAIAIADQQHPDEQLRTIDGRPVEL
jgi:hypothetical protein